MRTDWIATKVHELEGCCIKGHVDTDWNWKKKIITGLMHSGACGHGLELQK